LSGNQTAVDRAFVVQQWRTSC